MIGSRPEKALLGGGPEKAGPFASATGEAHELKKKAKKERSA